MISLITGKHSTVTPSINHAKKNLVLLWTEQATGRFTRNILLKNLVDTFETMLPYLSINMVWLLRKSKEGDGFQGWHKDLYLGGQITKTIVINVGSKVINNEEISTSLENDDFFEVDQWKETEEYALSGFNLEDKHCQDDEKQALIPTNHPSVSPSAIPHKNPLLQPVVINIG